MNVLPSPSHPQRYEGVWDVDAIWHKIPSGQEYMMPNMDKAVPCHEFRRILSKEQTMDAWVSDATLDAVVWLLQVLILQL